MVHTMMGGYFFGGIIVLLIAIWVAIDANKRGMNGVLWAIGVFLLCIVFLPLYLILRKPIVAQPYGQPYPPPGSAPSPFQPPAQMYGPRFCSNCGTQLAGDAKFCAKCGRPA